MLHNRILYPVGQGGFAFEHIDGVSIIYDCGSDTSPKRVEMYIDQLLNKGVVDKEFKQVISEEGHVQKVSYGSGIEITKN